MRTRVGWPLATLAAFIVGYDGASVVAPLDGAPVPVAPYPGERAEDAVPPAPLPRAAVVATRSVDRSDSQEPPPPLRGTLGAAAGETEPDLSFLSATEYELRRSTLDRTYIADSSPSAPRTPAEVYKVGVAWFRHRYQDQDGR